MRSEVTAPGKNDPGPWGVLRAPVFRALWIASIASNLALFSFMGWLSADQLLLFIFLLTLGTALNGPAWQAIVPELVPLTCSPDFYPT